MGPKRYEQIFILDPIPQYQADESRREDSVEAKRIHMAIGTAYRQFGYAPIRVPVLSPEERIKYFVRLLGGKK
jgi:predicted ATPase